MNLRELNLDPTLESHLVYEMSVQQVQDSNEEFVGILLLVSCQQIIYFLFQQFFRVLLFLQYWGIEPNLPDGGHGSRSCGAACGGRRVWVPRKRIPDNKKGFEAIFQIYSARKSFFCEEC